MIDPDIIVDVEPLLKPECFYRIIHRWVYEAMVSLHHDKTPIDFITICDKLTQMEKLEDVGGEAFLIGLINVVPTSINAQSYARLVAKYHGRRQQILAASQIANIAYEEEIEVDTQAKIESLVFNLAHQNGHINKSSSTLKELARELIDDLEKGIPPDKIKTGFVDIDRLLGGLYKSESVIVAARPGMGKTSLVNAIALNAAKNGRRVAMLSLEMSGKQLFIRMAGAESRIDTRKIREHDIAEAQFPILLEAMGRLSELRIEVDESSMLTPSQLFSKCQHLKLRGGLDLVVIDYLGFMSSDTHRPSKVNEVSDISRGIKQVAKELDVSVLTAVQLSRAVEQRQNKRPLLSDLRDSGAIEQDADVVMFIYRDEYYNPDTTERPNIAEIDIAKHRNGPTGTVDLYWHSKVSTFRNLMRQEINLNPTPQPHHVEKSSKKYNGGG